MELVKTCQLHSYILSTFRPRNECLVDPIEKRQLTEKKENGGLGWRLQYTAEGHVSSDEVYGVQQQSLRRGPVPSNDLRRRLIAKMPSRASKMFNLVFINNNSSQTVRKKKRVWTFGEVVFGAVLTWNTSFSLILLLTSLSLSLSLVLERQRVLLFLIARRQ